MAWAAEARRLNLCQPFQSEPPLTKPCLSDSEFWDLNQSVHDQTNPSHDVLTKFRDNATNERWDADREGVAFLASVISVSSTSLSKLPIATPLWTDIKMIETMLKTDPEMEMLRLRRRHAVSFRRYTRTGLIDESPVLDPWSQEELNLPQALTQDVNHTKLDIDRPAMEFLRDLLPTPNSDDLAFSASVSEAVSVQQIRFEDYCTSPLVPLAPSPRLPTLAPAVQDVAFTSTPDDLMILDLARVQQGIEALDEPEDLDLDAFDIACPVDQDISSPLKRKRARDLKVETPITALRWEASPEKRRKTTHLPDTVLALIPSLSSSDGCDGSLSMDPLTHAAASIAKSTIFQIENEQLTEFDTTMRTEVPVMDMSRPPAPWVNDANQDELAARIPSHRTLLSQFKRELLTEVDSWASTSGIEDALRKLPFSPRWGEIRPDGPFHDGSFTRYLREMDLDKEPEVHWLIAFDERPMVRDEEDDDEEEEEEELDSPWVVPDPFILADDHAVSSRTHRMTVSEKRNELVPAKTATDGKPDLAVLVQRRMQQLSEQPAKPPGEEVNHIHSTDSNLAKFMQLSGRSHVAQKATPEIDQHAPQPTEDSTTSETQERIQVNLAIPPLIKPDRAIQAIFSKSMLGNTTMIRQLQTLLPALDMIERDEMLDGPKPEQAPAQNLNHDADITVSPSTGIIQTTLQRLNQTGLPGQRSYFGVRERIAAASVRYERLMVLVSENRQQQRQQQEGGDGKVVAVATGNLSDRDCENLADLTSCGLGKDSGEVEVHYVPGEGQEVAQWIAACVTQHAVVSSSSSAGGANNSVKLLREETQWERFLRRAGMNAFAAQAVLGKVKNLSKFVELGVQERIAQLEGDVGGTQVLMRVSRVIDGGWRSAAAAGE